MSGIWVELNEDDSVESLAYRHGHFPDTLWDHPDNQALREQRDSMHVLCAGDRLFIPALVRKTVTVATGSRHRFRRRAVPSMLRLRLSLGDQPLADRLCRVELPGRPPITVWSDAEGWVEIPVMPVAGQGRLIVELDDGRELEVELAPRRLDPVDQVSGAQARLRNLGYLTGEVSDALDLATVLALARFQADHGLDSTGRSDDPTQSALLEAHGS